MKVRPVVAIVFFSFSLCLGGEFGGIGVQVVPVATGELVVLRVLENSPAADKGVRPGDLIVRIDDTALRGSAFTEIVPNHLWGSPGTIVTLRYLRPGERGIRTATMRRVPMTPEMEEAPGIRAIVPQ